MVLPFMAMVATATTPTATTPTATMPTPHDLEGMGWVL